MERCYFGEKVILKILDPCESGKVVRFYRENVDFFSPWEAGWADSYLMEEFQRAVLEQEELSFRESQHVRFYVFEKNDSACETIIGTVSFFKVTRGVYWSANMGYKIHKDYIKKGYGTDAVCTALQVVFDVWKLHRITCYVHHRNEASIRLMEKLHFEREGLCRSYVMIRGSWQDHYQYAYINSPEGSSSPEEG